MYTRRSGVHAALALTENQQAAAAITLAVLIAGHGVSRAIRESK